MKKINSKIIISAILIILIIIMSILLTACTADVEPVNNSKYYIKVDNHPEASFIYLYSKPADDVYIIYNEKTKVMYAVSNGSYNKGTFVELKNADGSLLTYEEGDKTND
jgi:hypothetical protein